MNPLFFPLQQIPPFESRIVASLFMDTLRSFREQAFLRVEFNNSVCDELFLPVDATVWQGELFIA